MRTLGEVFSQCRAEHRAALMPYLTAGFPSEDAFVAVMKSFKADGADIIEVGIPFSDPVADGPTIQYSSQLALEAGMTVGKTLRSLSHLCDGDFPPVVIMSYLNPLWQYGLDKFVRRARHTGVRGLIIPDIIPEEGVKLERLCRQHHLEVVYLLAPTSSPQRQRLILSRSRGFVYLVSVTGVTGARRRLAGSLTGWIREVKAQSTLPVAVGFGIARPDQAHKVARVADGVVVGSAIIDILRNGSDAAVAVNSARRFVRKLRQAMYHHGRQRQD